MDDSATSTPSNTETPIVRRRKIIAWTVPAPTLFGAVLAIFGVPIDALRYTLVGAFLAAFVFWVVVYGLAFMLKPSRDVVDVYLWSIGLGLVVGSGVSVMLSKLFISDS